MTFWEGAGVFAGIPLVVLFLIALPIFGPVWLERWRGRGHDDSAP
ncbi:hypothetical protein [Actinomycetospora sp. NBRC 106378]|jgi:hypothetical protein|nr:hypothetical protein [Actinomycetospora sp. NBRC 106378]GLZ52979.1 hypothetical protein Acsp07_25960 [Actinomycetospora sp. NBRC 106378]